MRALVSRRVWLAMAAVGALILAAVLASIPRDADPAVVDPAAPGTTGAGPTPCGARRTGPDAASPGPSCGYSRTMPTTPLPHSPSPACSARSLRERRALRARPATFLSATRAPAPRLSPRAPRAR